MNKKKQETQPTVVAIVQARMSSTRLPGKVLKTVLSYPLLQLLTERLKRASKIDKIVIATSTESADDQIDAFCLQHGLTCFRGSLDDVLLRYLQAAQAAFADIIVRLTADCPLIDAEIIDQVVTYFMASRPLIDYVSNTLIRTYPRGLDVEVFSMEALERACQLATLPYEREHVTPYIYQHRDLFHVGNVQQNRDLSYLRLTVDTQEDFRLVQHLFEVLYPKNPNFHLGAIVAYLEQNPEWIKMNAHIQQKTSE